MARRKNRKQPASQKEKKPALELTKNAVAQNKAASGPRISFITCIGGMFLTLVLGMYLATLLPDMLAERQNRPAAPASSAAPAPQPAQGNSLERQIGTLEKKAADKPDDASVWIELGNLYFDSGMHENSIHAYEHSLALKPDNPDVLTDLGIMYRVTGDYIKAIECFRKALAINPRHVNALFNEGVVLASDLGDSAEAKNVWTRLVEINPQAHAPDGQPVSDLLRALP